MITFKVIDQCWRDAIMVQEGYYCCLNKHSLPLYYNLSPTGKYIMNFDCPSSSVRKAGSCKQPLISVFFICLFRHVPELEPFLDINILRSKLTELDKILVHYDIAGLLDEIEKHLNVDYLIKKVPDLDEFLESAGFSSLLRDIKSLLETSMLGETVEDVKSFILSAQIDDKIHDMELLLNTSYLRRVIVPELERMVKASNISRLMDRAGNFLNMTYVAETIVSEVEKMWTTYSLDQQVELLVNLTTNMEFLKDFVRKMDEKYELTKRGERIANGDLADVVNEILTEIFAERVSK